MRERSPIDFSVVLKSAIETTRSLIEAAGHELTVSLPDDPMPLDGDSLFLDLSGHSTRLAHSGREALTAVEEFEPHVVFLDIGLPDMSGYEVACALRSQSAARQARLVAVTGWGTEEDRRLAHDAGFDDHLVKPVDTKKVSLVLEQEGKKHSAASG